MTERPILMQGDNVLKILAGTKTQTRRIVNLKKGQEQLSPTQALCRFGGVGDRLWVREGLYLPSNVWLYRADNQPVMVDPKHETEMIVWAHHKVQDYCPSIYMPRWASRLTLEIIEPVRMERLHNITEADAQAEGAEIPKVMHPDTPHEAYSYIENFKLIWRRVNGAEAWGRNDWVWRICFKATAAARQQKDGRTDC